MEGQHAAMGDDAMFRRWRETTKALLDSFAGKEFGQPYSMCPVADQLRKCNEDAFKPNMVSIGHRYKGRPELLYMEEIKCRCMMALLNRTKRELINILEDCMRMMLENDAAVRATYGEEIKLDRFKLATIMLYDGCFLLELLISKSEELNSKLPVADPFHYQSPSFDMVMVDVMKVENQMPLFILYKLFQLLFPQLDPDHYGIATYISITKHLALSYFGYSPDSSSTFTNPNLINATHLLELIHSTIVGKNILQIQQQVDHPIVENTVPDNPDNLNRCPSIQRDSPEELKRSAIIQRDSAEELKRCARIEIGSPEELNRRALNHCVRIEIGSPNIQKGTPEELNLRALNHCTKIEIGSPEELNRCASIQSGSPIIQRGSPEEQNRRALTHCASMDRIFPDELNLCANRLQAAGVTFTFNKRQIIPKKGECELLIKFNESNGVLEIPTLSINMFTEAKWRNLIAWEQDRIISSRGDGFSNESIFTYLAFFFNELICCESDVQLLKDKKIILDDSSNHNHDVVDLFRSMASGLHRGLVHTHYHKTIFKLNNYSETKSLIKYPMVLWHYLTRISGLFDAFQKFLRRGYNFAAALLGLLTLIQTFYTVISYHYPKK